MNIKILTLIIALTGFFQCLVIISKLKKTFSLQINLSFKTALL